MAMSNQIVAFQASNLPAALQARLASFNTASVLANLGGGVELDRISIRGGRFRINQAGMDEVVLQQLHIDGVFVFANPNLSKSFYTKAYDKDAEDKSPDCASSNGIGPDVGVKNPQSQRCATCPQAIWGSKISQSGKKVKACGDSQRMAFLPIDPSTNNFFMTDGKPKAFGLSIPAGSLKNLGAYVKTLSSKGLPVEIVLTRLTFDESADGQRLNFIFNAQLPEQAMVYIADYIDGNTDKLKELVGANIRPMENVQVAQAPAVVPQVQVAAPAPVQQVQVPPVPTQLDAGPSIAVPQFGFGVAAPATSPVVQPAVAPAPTTQPAPAISAAPAALLNALQGVMG
jgi:hypothetical protein